MNPLTNRKQIELVNDNFERRTSIRIFSIGSTNDSSDHQMKFRESFTRRISRNKTAHCVTLSICLNDLDIPPWMYAVWLDCLLETIREFDPAIDAQTEAAWWDVMAIGIKFMIERY